MNETKLVVVGHRQRVRTIPDIYLSNPHVADIGGSICPTDISSSECKVYKHFSFSKILESIFRVQIIDEIMRSMFEITFSKIFHIQW